MIETHDIIKIKDFEGLWDRGASDGIPPEFFRDCLNIIFRDKEVMTRYGLNPLGDPYDLELSNTTGPLNLDVYLSPAAVLPSIIYKNEVTHDIMAGKNGDILFTPLGNPKFRGINGFGKFFFILSQSSNVADNFFYVLNMAVGPPYVRKMGGLKAPEAPAMVAASSAPGKVERGTHILRVVFETESGFITAPGATVAYVAIANDKINLSVIPVGPAGTVKRHIVSTRAILNYNNDFENREYFFVPNATLNDNVTTVLANVSFYDADLFESADFTLDQLAEIPSFRDSSPSPDLSITGGLAIYRNRLVLWTDKQIYISAPNEPESYDAVNSIIQIDSTIHGQITACAELRGSLYIFTKFRTFVTNDNGGDPNSWDLLLIDVSNGAFDNGVGSVYLAKGNTSDYLLVKNPNGIMKFIGVFDSELTQKVKNLYEENVLNSSGGQLSIDDVEMRIYTTLESSCNKLLVGDYSRGMTPDAIRWSIWRFTGDDASAPYKIFAFKIFYDYTFRVVPGFVVWLRNAAHTEVKAYWLDSTRYVDNGISIESFIEFDMGPDNEKVNHFAGYQAIVTGLGSFTSTVYWKTKTLSANLRSLTLSTSSREKFLGFNVVDNRLGLRLGVNGSSGWFCFRKLVVYFKELYQRYGN